VSVSIDRVPSPQNATIRCSSESISSWAIVLQHSTTLLATTCGTIRREYSPDVAPAVNPVQKSSKRVGYLRATIKDSNFCKVLPFHDIRNRVARESLRREFGAGSLIFGSELSLPTGEQKTPGARVPGVFSCASPNPPHVKRFATIRACPEVPPLESRVRNATRAAVPNGHCSARHPVPNGPKLSDSLVDTP